MAARAPNWVTAPLTRVECPHTLGAGPDGQGGRRCGNNVLGKIRFPAGWKVTARPLDREQDANGSGPVKQCRDCHGWVQIEINPRGQT